MSKNWRNSKEYRIWRVIIIRRDKVCVICGSRKDRQAHHLNSASYFINERFDTDNGVCLCRKCHSALHIYYKRGYRKKCTKEDFYYFKKITQIKDNK